MRVLYFSKDYTLHDWRHLDKLSKTRHEVWYLRLSRGPIELEERPVPPGVHTVDWAGGRKHAQGLLRQLTMLSSLRRVLRRINPDLVHAGPIQSCGFLTAVTGFRPLLLMSWGSDILRDADRNSVWRWVTRFTLRRSAMVMGDCQAVKEKVHRIADYPNDRIAIYPWGIDLEVFRPRPVRNGIRSELGWQTNPVIISTRAWEPVYGIDVLIRGFSRVLDQVPEARLLLLGDGSMATDIRRLLHEHGISHAVHLAGLIPHAALPDYFNAADIYVSNSLSDGTSVSLLEAMACALPAVVTGIPGNSEWIKPGINGWLVSPGDAADLALKLTEALTSARIRQAMGQANRAVAADRADWNKNSEVLLETYERFAVGNGSRRAAD